MTTVVVSSCQVTFKKEKRRQQMRQECDLHFVQVSETQRVISDDHVTLC